MEAGASKEGTARVSKKGNEGILIEGAIISTERLSSKRLNLRLRKGEAMGTFKHIGKV